MSTGRLLLESATIGIGALLLASVCTTPTLEPAFMGQQYQAMSAGVDVVAGAEAGRPFSPTLARWVGLGGERWIAFPLLIGAIWLATVAYALRSEGLSRPLVAGITAIIATATPIAWTLVFPGYIDTMTYLMLWLSVIALSRNVVLWAVPFGIGVINHESILFLAPALFVYAVLGAEPQKRLRTGALWGGMFLLSVAPAAAMRIQSGGRVQDVMLGGALSQGASLLQLGVFAAFEVAWAIPIGVLLFSPRGRIWWTTLAVLAGTVAQLGFAVDTTRLMGPAFVAILLSLVALHRSMPAVWFRRMVWAALAINLAIPQMFVVPQGLVVSQPLPMAMWLSARQQHTFNRVPIFATPKRVPPPSHRRRPPR